MVAAPVSPRTVGAWRRHRAARQERYVADREERFAILCDVVDHVLAEVLAPVIVDPGCGPVHWVDAVLAALPGATRCLRPFTRRAGRGRAQRGLGDLVGSRASRHRVRNAGAGRCRATATRQQPAQRRRADGIATVGGIFERGPGLAGGRRSGGPRFAEGPAHPAQGTRERPAKPKPAESAFPSVIVRILA
jgi:hypothetical protein